MTDSSPYPKVNRGHLTPNLHQDIGWYEGVFRTGRPFRAEYWRQPYEGAITFYMSVLGLEDATKDGLKNLLVSEGVIEFDDDLYLRSGFGGGINLNAKKERDGSNNEIWSITIYVYDEDGVYVNFKFPLNRYKIDPDKFQYATKARKVSEAEYFLATIETGSENLYFLYFVNNTDAPIEVLFDNWGIAKAEYGAGASVDDITAEFLKAHPALHRNENIPARSCIPVGRALFGWDFDWANDLDVALKSSGKEMHISYVIQRLSFGRERVESIPVLNKAGWATF